MGRKTEHIAGSSMIQFAKKKEEKWRGRKVNENEVKYKP